MALCGGLTAIYFCRLCDLAIAVYDCGALGKCDRLAGFALGGVGLFSSLLVAVLHKRHSQSLSKQLCGAETFGGGTKYFDHKRGAVGDVRYQP